MRKRAGYTSHASPRWTSKTIKKPAWGLRSPPLSYATIRSSAAGAHKEKHGDNRQAGRPGGIGIRRRLGGRGLGQRQGRGGRVCPPGRPRGGGGPRSEEHTSELQSREKLVCRLLLEK